MREDEHTPRRLAQELADHLGAVPVLVTLLQAGGVASTATLCNCCPARQAGDAIRWLTTVGLVRRHGAALDADDHDDTYELTAIGRSLTTSLTALADTVSTTTHSAAPQPAEG